MTVPAAVAGPHRQEATTPLQNALALMAVNGASTPAVQLVTQRSWFSSRKGK